MQALQDYIQKLMAEKGLSKSALAEALGYRSKTSLDRIMADSSRESSLRKFRQAVLAAFPMTPEEKREQQALRAEYIAAYRRNLRAQLDNMVLVDENGNERPLKKKK